jgi:hypothetical protein
VFIFTFKKMCKFAFEGLMVYGKNPFILFKTKFNCLLRSPRIFFFISNCLYGYSSLSVINKKSIFHKDNSLSWPINYGLKLLILVLFLKKSLKKLANSQKKTVKKSLKKLLKNIIKIEKIHKKSSDAKNTWTPTTLLWFT